MKNKQTQGLTKCLRSATLSAAASAIMITFTSVSAAANIAEENAQEASPKVSLNSALSAMASEDSKLELQTLLRDLRSYEANFSQSIQDSQGEILQSSSGRLLMQSPNKLRWQVLQPDEMLLIADGKAVFNIDPFVEQVTIMQQAGLTDNNPLMLIISDDPKQWEKVDVSKMAKGYQVLSKDPDASIQVLNLRFEGEQLLALQSVDSQQQHNDLLFSQIKINHTINASEFEFVVPEHYVIDDQREPNTAQNNNK